MNAQNPLVGLVMGSANDFPRLEPAVAMLSRFEIPHEVEVASAHRSPDRALAWASGAAERGLKVLLVGAGGAAHLAGVVAAHSLLPVIGVPVNATPLNGLDALLSTVQMPTGIPVGCVAIDGAANAALLAIQILAVEDAALRRRLQTYRDELRSKTIARSDELKRELAGG